MKINVTEFICVCPGYPIGTWVLPDEHGVCHRTIDDPRNYVNHLYPIEAGKNAVKLT